MNTSLVTFAAKEGWKKLVQALGWSKSAGEFISSPTPMVRLLLLNQSRRFIPNGPYPPPVLSTTVLTDPARRCRVGGSRFVKEKSRRVLKDANE